MELTPTSVYILLTQNKYINVIKNENEKKIVFKIYAMINVRYLLMIHLVIVKPGEIDIGDIIMYTLWIFFKSPKTIADLKQL